MPEYTEEEIRGRSCRCCQKHYDARQRRGIVYTDEIVPEKDCVICNSFNRIK